MNRIINFSQVKAIILRHLFEWRRNLDRLVDSFWWATIDLIFWGLTSSYIKQNNPGMPNIVSLFIGGIILWVFVQNSQRDIAMPLLNEAWNRNLINLFSTPVRLREFIVSTLILGLLKLMITTLLLTIIAIFLYKFNIFTLGVFLIPALVNLILVGWWLGFIIDGLILRFGYRVESFAWAFVFIIYPFSAIFYPISFLPGWAQLISIMLPTSYIFENMRSVLFNGTFSVQAVIISFILNIFYLTLSVYFLKAMFSKALVHARLIKLN